MFPPTRQKTLSLSGNKRILAKLIQAVSRKEIVVYRWFSFLSSPTSTGIQDQLKLQLLFCSMRERSGVDLGFPNDREFYGLQREPGYEARRRG